MIDLNDAISSFSNTSNFQKIETFVAAATGEVTFWGERLVRVKSYAGSMELDDFADHITAAIVERNQNGDMPACDRISGLNIVKQLRTLYRNTTQESSTRNVFTQLMLPIQDVLTQGVEAFTKGLRWYVEGGLYKQEFLTYNLKTYEDTFDRNVLPDGSLDRYVMKAKEVRKLWLDTQPNITG